MGAMMVVYRHEEDQNGKKARSGSYLPTSSGTECSTRIRKGNAAETVEVIRGVAMASLSTAAASLSLRPSSYFHSFGVPTKEFSYLPDKRAPLVIYAQKKVKKIKQIILKEDVNDLGTKGQLIKVRAGYYRNFLLPMGKAQLVTPAILKEMQMEEERIEAEKRRVKEEAQQLALIFESVGVFKVKRKGGRGKLIFGSVTAQDLVDIIKAQLQRDVDKRIVSLPEIRETGEYFAELKLHPEVTARVRVIVTAN